RKYTEKTSGYARERQTVYTTREKKAAQRQDRES
ncbi:hypothetical protein ND16A_1546, partial [Thalassotalea sp. ND16A]